MIIYRMAIRQHGQFLFLALIEA